MSDCICGDCVLCSHMARQQLVPIATPGDMARDIQKCATDIQVQLDLGRIDTKEIGLLLWRIRQKSVAIQGVLGELFRDAD